MSRPFYEGLNITIIILQGEKYKSCSFLLGISSSLLLFAPFYVLLFSSAPSFWSHPVSILTLMWDTTFHNQSTQLVKLQFLHGSLPPHLINTWRFKTYGIPNSNLKSTALGWDTSSFVTRYAFFGQFNLFHAIHILHMTEMVLLFFKKKKSCVNLEQNHPFHLCQVSVTFVIFVIIYIFFFSLFVSN